MSKFGIMLIEFYSIIGDNKPINRLAGSNASYIEFNLQNTINDFYINL